MNQKVGLQAAAYRGRVIMTTESSKHVAIILFRIRISLDT